MRIVVLTGYYYPNMYPPAACIDKYIQELKKKHSIEIICQKSCYKYDKIPDESLILHYVTHWTNNLRNFSNYFIAKNKFTAFFSFILLFVRLYGVFITPFVYPSRLYWLKNRYLKKLKEINKDRKIDVIISVSMPVCSHLASLQFKQEHPEVKWFTYNTDPFTFYDTSYRNVIWKKRRKQKNFQTELLYYTSADINILTEELYESAINDFHIDKHKLLCFPYVLKEISLHNSIQNRDNQTVTVLYAGSLNTVIRNPEFALSVLTKVPNIIVHLYQAGDCDSILSKYASYNLKINGLVDRMKYLQLLDSEADILLNIGNNSKLQAPSKMLELLSTGKPIINFYFEQDNQYEMIEKYPIGINIGRDDIDPVAKLSEFCQMNRYRRMTYQEVEDIFPSNCLRFQLNKLENILTNKQ